MREGPLCYQCKRLFPAVKGSDVLRCEAFPDGIPAAIQLNEIDHRKPIAGDGGLLFVPRDPGNVSIPPFGPASTDPELLT